LPRAVLVFFGNFLSVCFFFAALAAFLTLRRAAVFCLALLMIDFRSFLWLIRSPFAIANRKYHSARQATRKLETVGLNLGPEIIAVPRQKIWGRKSSFGW
jgi:hypothetical protein